MEDKHAGVKIGEYVNYQRQKRELSLQDFATASGLTPSFLSKLENKKYNNVSLSAIEKLAKGFGMAVEDFLIKCGITEERTIILPDLEFYLREKFQFPTSAIEDITLFMQFIEKKYSDQIKKLKSQHKQYWSTRP